MNSLTDKHASNIHEHWLKDISQTVLDIAEDQFYSSLNEAISRIPQVGNALLFHYPKQGQPRVLYTCYTTESGDYQRHVERYLDGPYILDPFYHASTDGIAPGAYLLADIAPDDFLNSEYYREYYLGTRLEDELSYLQPLPEGGHLHLSVAYTGTDSKIPESTVTFLKSIAELINALLIKHWQLHESKTTSSANKRIHLQLERALVLFGSSILTGREQNILQLILHGHSNRSAAEKLAIAESTVKIHRKHMYEKFDIKSQAELFHLFIDSLSCYDAESDADPLLSYMGKSSS